ncbi:hypothetical protein PoB_001109000 [Plakobranchus ocellatus]|uniref:Uncharacterized protein n=1 Tax=Plakobranchus ocellatus TaxID=259542 RepID=A0AAV3YPC4_9GAST|nr:hypothetical protein PoB_001109000 [Plakobranchus ocellatus]
MPECRWRRRLEVEFALRTQSLVPTLSPSMEQTHFIFPAKALAYRPLLVSADDLLSKSQGVKDDSLMKRGWKFWSTLWGRVTNGQASEADGHESILTLR